MPPFAASDLPSFDDSLASLHASFCIHSDGQDAIEAPQSSPPPSSSAKKSVRIDTKLNQVEFIEVASQGWTSEQIDAVWYARDEYETIKQELLRSIRTLQCRRPLSSNECSHGLDVFIGDLAVQRECNKVTLQRTVLAEQARQRRLHGCCNAEQLGAVAQKCVVQCRAAMVAIQKQQEYKLLQYNGTCYYDDDAEEEALLSKQARPALSICCFDLIKCLQRWSWEGNNTTIYNEKRTPWTCMIASPQHFLDSFSLSEEAFCSRKSNHNSYSYYLLYRF